VIVRARTVITMDGAPINDGAVRVHRDRIVEVGNFSELAALSTAVEARDGLVDLGEQILLPGLINAHCHLDYTCLRGRIPHQNSFADWIRAINAEKTKLAPGDYLRSIADGFREARRFGTSSIVNLEAFPELIVQLPPPPLRIWWCAEFIDVNATEKPATQAKCLPPQNLGEIVSAAVRELKSIPNNRGGMGLAPHAPFTASAELYRTCEKMAERDRFLLTTHVAESREEMEMFCERSGPLFEFLKSLGRPMDDCGANTPLAVFLEKLSESRSEAGSRAITINRPYHRWLITHLNELAETDFDLLRGMPQRPSIAHCPRSHAYFGHSPFAFERLDALGANICLATDSLASNTDLSLFAEMREFQRVHAGISAQTIVAMVTVNPAKAIQAEDFLGKIRPGYQADMIAIPATSETSSAYESIINFTGDVPWIMIGGEPA
jgi:cytosine/adenosine deaminase-related metal-dependent hydrolase